MAFAAGPDAVKEETNPLETVLGEAARTVPASDNPTDPAQPEFQHGLRNLAFEQITK